MSYEEKLKLAMDELSATKLSKSSRNPLMMKLLGSMGFKVRPPHYSAFAINLLTLGCFFGGSWGLFMYIFIWLPQNYPIAICILASLGAGLFFGLIMAAYYKFGAHKYKLTAWEDLGEKF